MRPRVPTTAGRRFASLSHRRIGLRYSSTRAASPSPKICCVPFQQPPHTAADRLHTFALISSAQWGNLVAALLRVALGPFGQLIGETFGLGSNVRMKTIKPVYYPIWRTDAVVEGTLWPKGKQADRGTGVIGTLGAHVPGNSFAPLSYLSFANQDFDSELLPYNPSEDLDQLGEGWEIVPIPFTASPFGLIEQAKSNLGERAELGDRVFDVKTWNPSFLAAYPIFFPLYLAEFQIDHPVSGSRSVTLVMDAHSSRARSCRVSGPPAPEIVERDERFKSNYWISPSPFAVMGRAAFPPNHSPLETTEETDEKQPMITIKFGPDEEDPLQQYSQWMSPPLSSNKSIPPSPLYDVELREGGVKWDDARILSWSGEERMDNEVYFNSLLGLKDLDNQVKHLKAEIKQVGSSQAAEPSQTRWALKVGDGGGFKKEQVSLVDLLEETSQMVEEAKDACQRAKPAWLKKYEKTRANVSSEV